MTREGLPHAARQLVLRERGVLDLALAATQVITEPAPFSNPL